MEKLFSKIKKESLSQDEKTKILSVLRSFVNENPVKRISSPFYNSWFIFRQRIIAVPVAVILILILTGGTVFAAKKSLPGDRLYPIKMLNEKVESMAAPNPKVRAQVEASHAISRLEEVEQLVTSNKQLGKGAGEEIGNNFQVQAQEVTNNINKLRGKGNEEDASKIHSDFKTMLIEHEKTITELSNSANTETETKKELGRVASDVHSELEKKLEENYQNSGEVKGAKTHRESKQELEQENGDSSKQKNKDD